MGRSSSTYQVTSACAKIGAVFSCLLAYGPRSLPARERWLLYLHRPELRGFCKSGVQVFFHIFRVGALWGDSQKNTLQK